MSEKKPNQWMPLHIDDFLSRTTHLTTEEIGAYFLLMCTYWRNQEPLVDDDRRLGNIARVSPDQWDEMKGEIRSFFHEKDGRLHQHRMDKEMTKAVKISRRNQENGARGGRPKNPKTTQTETQTEPKNNPDETQGLTETEPRKNTRACKGPYPVGGDDSPHVIEEGDADIESALEASESEWSSDPKVVEMREEARKKAAKNKLRGVA